MTVVDEAGSNWRVGAPAHDLAMGKTIIRRCQGADADLPPVEQEWPDTPAAACRVIAPGDLLQRGMSVEILRPEQQAPGVHPRRLQEREGKAATRYITLGEGIQHGDWNG